METRDLSAHVPYSAGRGVEEVARELGLDPDGLVKLSSNENPFGPSPAAVEVVRDAAEQVHTYPKSSHTDLTERLAERWSVEPAQVWLSPGGDGFLDYLSRTFLHEGDRVLAPDPGFAYYPMSARSHGATVDRYRLSKADNFEQSTEVVLDAYDGQRIVYVTTPHNPTGSEMPLDEIEALAAAVDEETLVVVDEAYGKFTDQPSARSLIDEHDNVAILRTFSKTYGLAGLRVGYGLVPADWADAYDRINTPFAVNKLGCLAGLAALDDEEHVRRTVEGARWAREYMRDNLDARTWESGGNFVLAEVGDAAAVAEAAQQEGVIIRDCSSFGLSDCVRITCGTEPQTRTAVETINEVLE
ncbi:histidinol-phosphate transaminase [Halovenus sp. WSH3]|uniref:Histidinol-phosphate aminotransferase n=1 Tax=Halovenus carboxidivorans TaxID=2692199 RepID=A0A6B0TC81_9EURY|nr:histidinol-phosphate transaminase [Halovenus carboxidivorans]MXR52841.1 histidinol-phosphate transaminase [Halovenus carboxidivorans]